MAVLCQIIHRMDRLDKKILAVLQANARASQYAARHVLGERDMAAKRRRGGQATAARGKAKPAGRKA